MVLKSPKLLATLDEWHLTEALTQLGEQARVAMLRGDTRELGALRDLVEDALKLAAHDAARQLQVARAFLFALGRVELSGRERALRALLSSQPEVGAEALRLWAHPGAIRPEFISEYPSIRQHLEKLAEAGVCEARNGVWWLLPEARPLVLDMVEPLVFRLWRQVNTARGRVLDLGMNRDAQTEFLASSFGIDEIQARLHLDAFPLLPHESSFSNQTSRSSAARKVVWASTRYKPDLQVFPQNGKPIEEDASMRKPPGNEVSIEFPTGLQPTARV